MPISRRDLNFVLHDVLNVEAHYESLNLAEPPTRELVDAILDEMTRFCDAELAPLNAVGDVQGCTFDKGEVRTPDGFKAAYKTYVDGGWSALTGDPRWGGQGLPESLSLLVEECIGRSNMAWAMYPGLSRGVVNALGSHGSDEQKRDFLVPLLSGQWTGTMCLTEPHAGSDVGLARTKAQPLPDGAYAVSGTKIFISAGEHDLSENIVHLVLARLPDAPEGTKGISMFVVPKFDLDGERNAVTCAGIEEKMGIHGNATCVLQFDGARGYLVGQPNEGMKYMFTMMNAARVVVGLQGVCLADAALERAGDYARERLQMRALSGPRNPQADADPIIVHPDVRKMLLIQRAVVEGGRALVHFCGQAVDRLRHGSEQERADADALLDFLTPVVKGFLTELGFESVNHAVQIHGGHGYVAETGVEQYVRDARITMIYEGTTQIQALDLLGRKVLQTQGAGLRQFVALMESTAEEAESDFPEMATALRAGAQEWAALSMQVGAKAQQNLDEVGAAAVDYLFYSGYMILAYFWARMAVAAEAQLKSGAEDPFYAGKVAVARFVFARLLPRTAAHKQAIDAGGDTLLNLTDAMLVPEG